MTYVVIAVEDQAERTLDDFEGSESSDEQSVENGEMDSVDAQLDIPKQLVLSEYELSKRKNIAEN